MYSRLVAVLGMEETHSSAGAWLVDFARGCAALVKSRIPGTRERKLHLALTRGRALYAVNGHVQVCCLAWQWEDEQEQTGAFFFRPADNADQLEPAALAYLASIGKSLDQGQFVKCPPVLAARAVWSN